jgi:hypothetical protein
VNDILGAISAIVGALALLTAGLFAARATRAAAVVTAEAQRAAAVAAAAPAQTGADLSVLKATIERLDREAKETRNDVRGLRVLVRALGRAYENLRDWAAAPVGPPPEPEERVKEYLRTGA